MGWASGTYIMEDIIKAAQEHISETTNRREFYKKVIKAFESGDWDCQTECIGRDNAFDEALKELYPDWFKED